MMLNEEQDGLDCLDTNTTKKEDRSTVDVHCYCKKTPILEISKATMNPLIYKFWVVRVLHTGAADFTMVLEELDSVKEKELIREALDKCENVDWTINLIICLKEILQQD